MKLGPQTQHILQSNPSRSHLPNSKVIYLAVFQHHRRLRARSRASCIMLCTVCYLIILGYGTVRHSKIAYISACELAGERDHTLPASSLASETKPPPALRARWRARPNPPLRARSARRPNPPTHNLCKYIFETYYFFSINNFEIQFRYQPGQAHSTVSPLTKSHTTSHTGEQHTVYHHARYY